MFLYNEHRIGYRQTSSDWLKIIIENTFLYKEHYGFQSLTRPSSLYEHNKFWCGWCAIPITSFSWICKSNQYNLYKVREIKSYV